MTRFNLSYLTLALFAIAAVLIFAPQKSQAEEFSDAQKAEIKMLFEQHLLDSGGIILQSVNQYQAELEVKDRKEAAKKAEGFIKGLDNQKNLPMAGNKDGDITIVEFFDYNCGYCRRALEELQTVINDDPNVRVIFIDMPILGPDSMEAAKWSLAAAEQGKYFEFHTAVMEHNGPATTEVLEGIAKDLDLDLKKLEKAKDSTEIQRTLDGNILQARDVGISGTPGFIFAGQVFPGFMPAERIKEVIAEHRKKS